MYCMNCGNVVDKQSDFCSYCCTDLQSKREIDKELLYYHLPYTDKRSCNIKVYSYYIEFEGDFWYLKDKEFYQNKQSKDIALIQNFLGMGYLKKRSYKKCVAFVLGGLILSTINTVIDKLSEWVDKANSFLQWIGQTVTLPEWINITLNIVTVACLILGVILFFSKKNVVEISFTDKRICIPQKSISNVEYTELYQVLKRLSRT